MVQAGGYWFWMGWLWVRAGVVKMGGEGEGNHATDTYLRD